MAGLIPFNRRNTGLRPASDFYNALDDFFNNDWFGGRSLVGDTFKVDVKEDDKEYAVEAEMPGVQKDEIGLTLDHGQLTIAVRREEEKNEEGKSYIHRERRYSSMQRSIYLADADDQSVKAKLENGVLKVSVSKKAGAGGAQPIEIE